MRCNLFFWRLMQVSGRKLMNVRKLPITKNNDFIDVKHWLFILSLTEKQQYEFWHCNELLLDQCDVWLTHFNNHYFIPYTDLRYPALLKEMSASPLGLFVKGDLSLLHLPQLAMVGSRYPSQYGQQMAYQFAQQIAATGITITSGLALGIDGLCHRGALQANGLTIAVLGSGIERLTPRSHCLLSEQIVAQKGALVSEFFPQTVAKPEYFPRRNRIISGLSKGVFVIEAGEKSGSLITARYALEQGRDVFALPGSVLSSNSTGTNSLIQQGAYLVSQIEDILFHYRDYSFVQTEKNNLSFKEGKIDQKSLYPDILALLTTQAMPVDDLARTLKQPVTEIMIKLIELELAGEIRRLSDGVVIN